MRELERLLGRKTMEVEVLKEALVAAREKKARLAVAVAATGRFPVKVVADTLGVARSNLVEQMSGASKRRGRYQGRPMSRLSITIEETTHMTRPAIHPGEILADELAELAVSPTELARQIKVPANRLSQIIGGKRSITCDTALRLGHWFGMTAEFWLNLQLSYDLRMAEQAAGAEIDGGLADIPQPLFQRSRHQKTPTMSRAAVSQPLPSVSSARRDQR